MNDGFVKPNKFSCEKKNEFHSKNSSPIGQVANQAIQGVEKNTHTKSAIEKS